VEVVVEVAGLVLVAVVAGLAVDQPELVLALVLVVALWGLLQAV
jgi:hypothetical protein